MKLIKILENCSEYFLHGNKNLETKVLALSQDSRENFSKSFLYFAVKGTQVDGHDYINDVVRNGASVVVCEKLPETLDLNVVYIQSDSIQLLMSKMVSNFYGNPSEEIKILAVTGTNGKTTVATLLYQSLMYLEKKASLFSTAGDFVNGKILDNNKKASSSMETIEFQSSLRFAVDQGCEYVCIEATSHALDQGRLGKAKISAAIFTNLTRDHLDYHGSLDHYAKSKKKLFDMLDKKAFAVINADDSYAAFMVESTKAKIISCGNKNKKNPILRDIEFDVKGLGLKGTSVSFGGHSLELPSIGDFNMYNALSVFIALSELGFETNDIIAALENSKGAKGRMEILSGEKKPGTIAIVDYAHTPDALENVLQTLSQIKTGKLISVVGVGGDRDPGKRPKMGKIALDNSDLIIFTSDNPRFEDPELILDDLVSDFDQKLYTRISDRALAIEHAVSVAKEGDIIIVAGKGHEEYQDVKGIKNHFSDQEQLKKYL